MHKIDPMSASELFCYVLQKCRRHVIRATKRGLYNLALHCHITQFMRKSFTTAERPCRRVLTEPARKSKSPNPKFRCCVTSALCGQTRYGALWWLQTRSVWAAALPQPSV